MLPQKPRLASGAYSAMNVAAPPYSPPVEKPWMSRSNSSRAGAAMPIWLYVGSTPIRNVQADITRIVNASTFCRPMRSPIGPRMMPPNGRIRKPAANRPSEASVVACTSPGKNALPMVMARYP